MTAGELEQFARFAAIVAGILFGGWALSSVIWVWTKKQIYAYGGSALSVVGVILMGLSIYKTIDVRAAPDGIGVKLAELEKLIKDQGQMAQATLPDTDKAFRGAVELASGRPSDVHLATGLSNPDLDWTAIGGRLGSKLRMLSWTDLTDLPGLHRELGKSFEAKNDYRAAVREYRKALELVEAELSRTRSKLDDPAQSAPDASAEPKPDNPVTHETPK